MSQMTDRDYDLMFAEMNGLPIPNPPLEPLTPTLGLFAEPVTVEPHEWGVPRKSVALSEAGYDEMFRQLNGLSS